MTLRRAVPTIAAFLLASTVLTSPALAQSAAGEPWAPQSNPGVEAEWLSTKPRPDLNFRADARPSREQTMAAVEYVAASQIKDMAQRPLALSTGSNLTQMSSNWVAATFSSAQRAWPACRTIPRPCASSRRWPSTTTTACAAHAPARPC